MNKALLSLMIITMLFSGCTSAQLSPARNLEGNWKTAFPVTFYIKTDFATGALEDAGSEDRLMEWAISQGSDENTVNVEVTFTSSNRNLITGSGYTPDIPLMSLIGTVSSSGLTLYSGDRIIGEFSFASDSITGTWDDLWEMAYAQEVYTKTNELKLIRE
jgi:hypothetical protein